MKVLNISAQGTIYVVNSEHNVGLELLWNETARPHFSDNIAVLIDSAFLIRGAKNCTSFHFETSIERNFAHYVGDAGVVEDSPIPEEFMEVYNGIMDNSATFLSELQAYRDWVVDQEVLAYEQAQAQETK